MDEKNEALASLEIWAKKGRKVVIRPGYNNHEVHSWVCSHVKLVFVFVGYSEAVPLVEMTCGINLNNR